MNLAVKKEKLLVEDLEWKMDRKSVLMKAVMMVVKLESWWVKLWVERKVA